MNNDIEHQIATKLPRSQQSVSAAFEAIQAEHKVIASRDPAELAWQWNRQIIENIRAVVPNAPPTDEALVEVIRARFAEDQSADLPVSNVRAKDREWWRENLRCQLAKIEEWNRRRAEKGTTS